ncbi:hypothetical protein BFP72_11025 [Reichenbachiella sp. 5M10]|uniref:transglutaminase-like domain-containing protein n=1 Tax=Reichenbachiella sp. 5M10 TaxID=1889772 RepID=UPI000C144AC6|nr:transglutaminase-like domain-containing protein [Reichenbachiella sp. 5M10]PIB35886.1 hypothetical protein BFP72_11025 [Reichenbachiella sp. 5M10]
MKLKLHLTPLLILLSLPSFGQPQQYRITWNNNKVGTYETNHIYLDTVRTTTTLQLNYRHDEGTTQAYVRHQFYELSYGALVSVSTDLSVLAGDTTQFIYYTPDSTRAPSYSPSILGPYGLQQLSQRQLNQVGDSIQCLAYSPDHGQAVPLWRTISSYEIILAQKYWIVQDSIPGKRPIESIYNQDFVLYSSIQNSPIGRLNIQPLRPIDSLIQFMSQSYGLKQLPSNIWLPDPKNVNAIQLALTTTNEQNSTINLTDNSFTPLPIDSMKLAQTTASNTWLNTQDLNYFSIADSLTRTLTTPEEIAYQLTLYCRSLDFKHPSLQLLKLARSIELPSRLVHGYYYQHGQWVRKYWVQIGIADEWVIFNPNPHSPISSALYLPLATSDLYTGILPLFDLPMLTSIHTLNYLKDGKAHRISTKQEKIKSPYYENKGLGLQLDIPKGFHITPLDTTRISPLFLVLTSDNSHISFEYITPPILSDNYQTHYLQQWNNASHEITTLKDLKREHYCIKTPHQVIIMIPDGSSFYLIKISGEHREEALSELIKKNLKFKE